MMTSIELLVCVENNAILLITYVDYLFALKIEYLIFDLIVDSVAMLGSSLCFKCCLGSIGIWLGKHIGDRLFG